MRIIKFIKHNCKSCGLQLVQKEWIGKRKDEMVHHIDHDKTNNNLENLIVMTNSEHVRFHHATGHYSLQAA